MMIWNLVDESFKHDIGMVAGQKPENIQWDRERNELCATFYTNKCAYTAVKDTPPEHSYFILSEPATIIHYTPEIVESIIDKFHLMFTHDSRYLAKWPEKCRWINGGGIWIGGSVGKGSIDIKEKSEICSFMASSKIFCKLHHFRANLAQYLQHKVHVFGTIKGEKEWIPVNESLEKYYFSIIIENHIDDLYFTEKLLNCFATGTIPIYIGARKINTIFDANGIIQFDTDNRTIEEGFKWFDETIKNLTPEMYHYKLPAVLNNFETCKQFRTIEDYIYNNYKDEIL